MNILHIEDSIGIIETVKKLCETQCDLVSVKSLAAAKCALALASFDVLLIDLNLSDSRGLDTVLALKGYGIPMVVLTSDPTEQFVCAAADLGVADYISKHVLYAINLPARLSFVRSKSRFVIKSTIQWEGMEELKPYLSCGKIK